MTHLPVKSCKKPQEKKKKKKRKNHTVIIEPLTLIYASQRVKKMESEKVAKELFSLY